MNKRLLFITYGDNNLLKPIDYSRRRSFNTGDNVYFFPGMSYFYDDDIEVRYVSRWLAGQFLKEDENWAKRNFDLCVYMEANILNEAYRDWIKEQALFFERIGIPIYILGMGAQSTADYSDKFLDDIRDNAKRYLDAIYSNGGAVTVRGEFSKSIVEKLGFKDVFVSGCPSLYYMDYDFIVEKKKVDRSHFKLIFSGSAIEDIPQKVYEQYSGDYYDQGMYFRLLYEGYDETCSSNEILIRMAKEHRVKGSLNYYPWFKAVQKGDYCFSYGSRIHGNIISLQAGIPAFVKVIDSRVREIAEFFSIPNSYETPFNDNDDDLFDLYQSISMDKFNAARRNNMLKFQSWLSSKEIPNVVGNNGSFKKYISSLDYSETEKRRF